jgi:hypothetical protein
MTKIIYEIVEHDGGWAYQVDGTSPKPSLLMTWLGKRQIAQRRSKSFLERRRTFRTKTRMVVGTMKRRQAVIDPRPTSRAEGTFIEDPPITDAPGPNRAPAGSDSACVRSQSGRSHMFRSCMYLEQPKLSGSSGRLCTTPRSCTRAGCGTRSIVRLCLWWRSTNGQTVNSPRKLAAVLALLGREGGASIGELSFATGLEIR